MADAVPGTAVVLGTGPQARAAEANLAGLGLRVLAFVPVEGEGAAAAGAEGTHCGLPAGRETQPGLKTLMTSSSASTTVTAWQKSNHIRRIIRSFPSPPARRGT